MLRLLVFVPFIASAVLSNYVEPVYEHHVRGAPSSQWAVPNPSKRDIRFEGGGAGSVELDAMKINSGGLNGVVGGRGVGGGEGFAYFQIPPPHLMRAIPLSDGEVAYVDDPRPRELRIQGGGAGSVELDPMSINAGGLNGIIGGRGVGGGEGFGYFQTPGVYGMRAVAPVAQTVKAIGIPHYANEEVPSPFAKMIAVPQYSNDEQPSRIVKAIGIPHYANEEEPTPFAKMIAVPQYSNGEQPSRIVRTNAVPQYPTSAHLVRAIAIPQYTNAEQPLPIVRAYAIPQYSNGEQSAQVVRAYSLPQYSNDDQSPQLRELRIQGGGAGTVELDPMSINSGGLKGVIGGRGVGGGEGFGYFQTPEAYVPADENESTKLRELRLQGGGAGSVELDPMKVNAGGLVGVIGGRGVGGGEGFGYFQTPNARKR